MKHDEDEDDHHVQHVQHDMNLSSSSSSSSEEEEENEDDDCFSDDDKIGNENEIEKKDGTKNNSNEHLIDTDAASNVATMGVGAGVEATLGATVGATVRVNKSQDGTDIGEDDDLPSYHADANANATADEFDDGDDFDDEGDEFDDIDWEDGNDEDEDEKSQHDTEMEQIMHHKLPSKGITIHFNDNINENENEHANDTKNANNDTKNNQRKKKKHQQTQLNKIQQQQLQLYASSPQLKLLLLNIQRAHMLSMTSRILFQSSLSLPLSISLSLSLPNMTTTTTSSLNVSSSSSSLLEGEGEEKEDAVHEYYEYILNVAHSLIPMEFLDYSNQLLEGKRNETSTSTSKSVIPNMILVKKFCTWYFEFVNRNRTTEESNTRRRSTRSTRNATSTGSMTNTITNANANANGGRGRSSKRKRNVETSTTTPNSTNSSATATATTTTSTKSSQGTRSSKRLKKTNSTSPISLVDDKDQTQDQTKDQSQNQSQEKMEEKSHRLLDLFEYLSSTSIPISTPTITPLDKSLILLCMMRSMGWRVRFVNAIDPMEKDLSVDHPMFSLGMQNAFHAILKSTIIANPSTNANTNDNVDTSVDISVDTNKGNMNKRKRKSKRKGKGTVSDQIINPLNQNLINSIGISQEEDNVEYPWIEVLTRKNIDSSSTLSSKSTTRKRGITTATATTNTTSKKGSSRWIHIDSHFQLIDKPLLVELIRGQKHHHTKKNKATTPPLSLSSSLLKKNGKIKPISFVVAIEQSTLGTATMINSTITSASTTTRIVDVSPRYASKWSNTLKLRGATTKEMAKSGGNCSNIWWSQTIKKMNAYFARRYRQKRLRQQGQLSDCQIGTKLMMESNNSSSSFAIERKKTGEEILVINDSSDDDDDSNNNNNGQRKKNDSSKKIDMDSEDGDSDVEADEFMTSKKNEAIPTSKNAFKNHPLYVIPSVLKSQEVLALDAKKRICGMFKGELVYKRNDVSIALTAQKWLYKSHKVRECELRNPVKTNKARKKPVKKGFQALTSYGGDANESQGDILASSIAKGDFDDDEGKKSDVNHLYGKWQTDPWSPPYIGPNDDIQVNEYRNVELALINPGLVHLQLHRISLVAKKLGIPYAPCLLGFEGRGGIRTPTIRGIVVHEHNADLLREAHTEFESQAIEDAYKQKQKELYRRWRRLINGVMTADRLKREYEKT